MKRDYLKRNAIFLLIIAIFVTLVACKKDKLTDSQSFDKSVENLSAMSADDVVKRITDFDTQIKQVKKGVCRGVQNAEIDSVLWNIESLFNTSFSFPELNYVEKKRQELSFKIKVQNGKYLAMNDVCILYDEIVSNVREAYRNDGIDADKSLLSIVLNRGEIISDELEVKLLLITGKVLPEQYRLRDVTSAPFDEDDCWYFGEYGGSCDDPSIVYDAAKALEDKINLTYQNKRNISNKYRSIYVGMTNVSLTGNEYWNDSINDYYIFYKQNCPDSLLYLNHEDLNKYYQNMIDVIFKIVPKDKKYSSVLSQSADFMEVYIDGMFSLEGKNTLHNHNTDILYSSKYQISKSLLIQPKDLLK